MIVTLKQLDKLDACTGPRNLFEKLFGASVEITKDLCLKHASDFDWAWAADNLLGASARAEYDKVCASAWAEYDKVCAPAWAEYDKVCASAWAEYVKD